MLLLTADEVRARLPWTPLVQALRNAFAEGWEAPARQHYDIGPYGRTLLVMPAWQPGRMVGVKLVTVYPDNTARSLPSIAGLYVLFDGDTGVPRAVIDGAELTARRTAAASALAASYLAREDARTMTIVGTGRLSRNLVEAHMSVRPIEQVWIWGRQPEKTCQVVADLSATCARVAVAEHLEAAVRQSDVVSCATLSTEPLVHGHWLRPGTHLDLVGAFKPGMRETDAAVWSKADVIAVDTRDGARAEAGDLIFAEAEGISAFARISADLFQLASGQSRGRRTSQDITVFKSVGTALEDLAAAVQATGIGVRAETAIATDPERASIAGARSNDLP